tara:strand:- start:336 stop:1097 length:762 start_codon:yes stop_codon:yes gene_type:complete
MELKKTGAIIQARMSSTRLPKKVLMPLIDDLSILDLQVRRLKKCDFIDNIILATSRRPEDKVLKDHADSLNIDFFTGSESNVLERFFECASQYELDQIIRVTADDPFKDPKVIEMAFEIFTEGNFDYVSNTLKPTFPEGIDIEIFSYDSLSRAYSEASLNSEKEHVTPYIWKNKDSFKIKNFEADVDYSEIRLTVDYEEDLILARKILKNFYPDIFFGFKEIVEYIKSCKIENKIQRNEGYKKSILEEDINEN